MNDPVYLYATEDVPKLGTLTDYAEAWEHCYYGTLHITPTVRRVDRNGDVTDPVEVEIQRYTPDSEDRIEHVFTVPGSNDVAFVWIDGRA